jgi:hypothetical protein
MEYTLADLTKLTGNKRRTVQLWAEAGVIIADPGTHRAGTGVHRRFSREEAVIGLAINPLAKLHIGDLLTLSRAIRGLFNGEVDGRSWWPDVERCIRGEIRMSLIIANSASGAKITALTHEPGETNEARWLRIGAGVAETEEEKGGFGQLIPLEPHLRVLR